MISRGHQSSSCQMYRLAAKVALVFAIALLPVMAAQSVPPQAPAPTYTILYAFTGGADGSGPVAPLIMDKNGNLYGTTIDGGLANNCLNGASCGVVFKLDPAGNETVLHSFTGGADGANPWAGLIGDADGNLYGTTTGGGLTSNCFGQGCGVVFKLDPGGNETVLYSFTGAADGEQPYGGVVRDPDGNLYGTTLDGGTYAYGTVFKIDATGVFSVLYTFTGGADGGGPAAGLIRDAAGNLYGTTAGGGTNSGTVFKLDPAGNETVLYAFSPQSFFDGEVPVASLVRDAAGNLYGTTERGGATDNGTVFEIDPTGKETILRSFMYTKTLGASPQAGVIRDVFGNLYGTTMYTGANRVGGAGAGAVFKLDPTGRETALYDFTGPDGYQPYASLLLHQGNFYGTVGGGGPYGYGVVFKLGH